MRSTPFGLTMALTMAVLASACGSARVHDVPAPAQSRAGDEGGEYVWVCHGNRNPRWQRVGAPAADAHRRHGDRVSRSPQEEGAPCRNAFPA